MARRLEALLRPGEEVIFKGLSDRRLIWLALALFAGLFLAWGAYVLLADLSFGRVFWIFHTLGVVIAAVAFHRSVGEGAAVVTDRRLLLDRGPTAALWGWQRIHDIPHGDIAKVTRVGRGWFATLTLVLADGRQMSLENIPKKDRLVEALNARAGADPARDATRA